MMRLSLVIMYHLLMHPASHNWCHYFPVNANNGIAVCKQGNRACWHHGSKQFLLHTILPVVTSSPRTCAMPFFNTSHRVQIVISYYLRAESCSYLEQVLEKLCSNCKKCWCGWNKNVATNYHSPNKRYCSTTYSILKVRFCWHVPLEVPR